MVNRCRIRTAAVYILCGAAAAAVNMVLYGVLIYAGAANLISAAASWLAAVTAAFFLNRAFVFRPEGKAELKEFRSFLAARISTGALDMAIMYAAVDVFDGNKALWKLISNGVIAAINFILSRRIFAPDKQ